MTSAVVASALVVIGAAFSLIAAVGLWRMPDVFSRMHAATKAGTVGAGLMLAGVAVSANDAAQVVRALALIGFLLVTAPVGAHLVGRAVHRGNSDSEENAQ